MSCILQKTGLRIAVLMVYMLLLGSCNPRIAEKKVISQAEVQVSLMLEEIERLSHSRPGSEEVSPRSLNSGGELVMVKSRDWTSGFFPGILWYLYELTGNEAWRNQAKEFTKNLEQEKNNGTTHDMGFKIYCSFGHCYRLTGDTRCRKIIVESAYTLAKRFDPEVGCIRSWDHNRDKWQFPVIIDNMMNLELLFAATRLTGDPSFRQIAISHANTTMKNHFRGDFGTYHVVDYDQESGDVLKKNTHQGYRDESTWSRGQAWALYGYTICYRETKDETYLRQAENIASFLLNHPRMPGDYIPYWDFDAPGIPDEPRDASAASIMASAFYELSSYSENGSRYRERADEIIKNLSDKYLAEKGGAKGFILLHSTGSAPAKSEVDVPLIYSDYYFIEALVRAGRLKEGKPVV